MPRGTFDSLQPISRGFLTERVGALGAQRCHELCSALLALADC